MSLITPDFGLLFWMAIVFLVVLGILWKFGFPVIVNMVNNRKAYIDESLRKAHEANEKLANIKAESEVLLQEAREKQAQILKEAAATRDAIVQKAQTKHTKKATGCFLKQKSRLRTKKGQPSATFVNK